MFDLKLNDKSFALSILILEIYRFEWLRHTIRKEGGISSPSMNISDFRVIPDYMTSTYYVKQSIPGRKKSFFDIYEIRY